MCETCIHESVCMFRGDFIELYTKASNDVYGNVFNVTCNEYKEKEEFRKYLCLEKKIEDSVEYELVCRTDVYTYRKYEDALKHKFLNKNMNFKMYEKRIRPDGSVIINEIN